MNLIPEMAMQSTSKVPPAWMPSFEKRGYPFHVRLSDVGVWWRLARKNTKLTTI